MSHANLVYPKPISADLSLAHRGMWNVRENEDRGANNLVDLTDTVIDKLVKAEAVAWVLHDARHYPDNAVAETTAVIADLIREALDAHRELWERVRDAPK